MARQLQPCGTPAAYQRHIRYRTPICDLCRAAQSRYKATVEGRPWKGTMTRTQAAYLAQQARGTLRRARVEDYQFLLAQGYTREQAAWRLQLSQRTLWRYDADLRQEAAA